MKSNRIILLALITTLIITFSLPALAAAAPSVPLTDIQMLAKPSEDNQSTLVTLMGTVAKNSAAPFTTKIIVPNDFKLTEILQYSESPDKPSKDAPKYTTKKSKQGTVFSIDITEGSAFMAAFSIESVIYDPTQMGDTPIATLELVAPSDLNSLTIGFQALPGTTGAGKDVVKLGTDQDGAEIYGTTFENIKKGESSTAVVAFGTAPDAQTGPSAGTGTPLGASFQMSTTTWVILGLLIALIAALVTAILIVRKNQAEHDPNDGEPDNQDADRDDDEELATKA